jgi:hypothetical protein
VHRWWPEEIDAIPDGVVGHAIIESTEKLVVAIADEPYDDRFDVTMFRGIAGDVAGPEPSTAAQPLLLRRADMGLLPPAPTVAAPTQPPPTPGPLPEIVLPAEVAARSGGTARVPFSLVSHEYPIASLYFSVDVAPEAAEFDPTDGDGDGIPDSVRFILPDGSFARSVSYDPADAQSELEFEIAQPHGQGTALPDGLFVEVTLNIVDAPNRDIPALRVVGRAKFVRPDGSSVEADQERAATVISEPELHLAFLPRCELP